MHTNGSTEVHIMHTDAVVAAGLDAILSAFGDMRPSVHAAGPRAAAHGNAEVIVTDYRGGIELCGGERAGPPVLIVTQHDKEWAVRQALDSGVHGYLLQSFTPDELVHAVRSLQGGKRYLCDAVAHNAVAGQSRAELTPRETDVLKLLSKGHCNKLIARELDIGIGTVKTHLKNLMAKLNATARTHAVVLAAERGIISPATGAG